MNGTSARNASSAARVLRKALELVPFVAGPDVLRARAISPSAPTVIKPGMVVLVALERQADALDGVGDEADRPIVVDRLEGLHMLAMSWPPRLDISASNSSSLRRSISCDTAP